MIILNHEQGSPEWYAARCGIPTASKFDNIITTRGEPSKQREKYMYQLAGEAITGKKEENYQSEAMKRGTELEAEARQMFEIVTGLAVDTVGLCLSDSKAYGCSPDGLVGVDAGLEIKSPLMATQVAYLLNGKLPIDYFQQVQGSMAITGRPFWWFVSYYPGIKPLIIKVERDDKFIQKLEEQLAVFCSELKEVVTKLKEQ